MKRLIYFALLGVITLSAPGCSDFLDTIPDNRTEIDEISKVSKLLANAYPRKTYAGILEARCDGMVDFGTTLSGSQQNESYEYMRAGFYLMPQVQAESDDSYERFWEDCYRAVSYANFALEALDEYGEEWDAAEAKLLRAEAKVCRAYAHFMLVCMYTNMFQYNRQAANPGIPYVEEPEEQVFKKYDRETVAVTLNKVKEDLFSELDNLGGPSAYSVPHFRFIRNAALAFAVRYCLFTKDYQGVINYANMLIPTAASHQVLTGSNNQNFDGTQKQYVTENDLAFQWCKTKMLSWTAYSSSGTNLYQPGIFFSNPANSSFLLSSEVESIVMRTFLGTYMASYAYSMETVSDMATANISGSRWALQPLQLSGDNTAFWIKYYEDMLLVNEAAGIGYVYVKTNLFRLEEVLLARAEAKAMLGVMVDNSYFDGAIDDLNMYMNTKIYNYNYSNHRLDRSRIRDYYLTQTGNAESFVNNEFNQSVFDGYGTFETTMLKSLLLCIMDFRRVEFAFEGMRYFDILRWNIPVTHTRMRDNMSRTMYPDDDTRILQIPESTILSGLQPNPMKNIREPWPGVIYEY